MTINYINIKYSIVQYSYVKYCIAAILFCGVGFAVHLLKALEVYDK